MIAAPAVRSGAVRPFLALLRRDVHVSVRELPFFLVRTCLQPLLFVVVFGYLLPRMGFVGRGYSAALLPGILAVSLALSSVQAVALPMVADFGFTREIDDRLLAPIAVRLVALEKVMFGVFQGLIAVAVVLPIARLIMGPVPGLTLAHGGAAVAVILLGAAAFSALGLLLGTGIPPQQIGLMFSVIVTPMIFFGCAYYPWQGLASVPALRWAVLVNPLVYVAEGLRGSLTPGAPHMPILATVVALAVLSAALWEWGARTFERRAIS